MPNKQKTIPVPLISCLPTPTFPMKENSGQENKLAQIWQATSQCKNVRRCFNCTKYTHPMRPAVKCYALRGCFSLESYPKEVSMRKATTLEGTGLFHQKVKTHFLLSLHLSSQIMNHTMSPSLL